MAHTLCHFEIFAEDPEKLSKFYEGIFEWKIVDAMQGYKLIDTGGGKDAAGGGMEKIEAGTKRPVLNYFLVDSIFEHLKKIEAAGGKVNNEKSPVPGYGYFATFEDPEGNIIGLWETDRAAK